jgi:ankyrin repeat protein
MGSSKKNECYEELLQTVEDQMKLGVFGEAGKQAVWSMGEGMACHGFRTLMKDPGPMFSDEEPRMMQVTLLHTTALRGQIDFMEWILEQGVDINAVDDRMRTPLYYAVAGSNYDAIQLLAYKGAAAIPIRNEFCDCDESSALMALTVLRHNPDAIDLIRGFGVKDGVEVNMNCHYQGKSLLTIAACRNDDHMVRHLIELNREGDIVDTNPVDDANGRGIISEMVSRGHSNLLKMFIDLDCNVNHVENDGSTALHHTVNLRNKRIDGHIVNGNEDALRPALVIIDDVWTAELLLDEGANISARDQGGRTPLIRAVQCGAFNVAKLIIDNSIHDFFHLDMADNHGINALCVAAASGDDSLVTMLLKNGANPFMYPTTSNIRSAFHWASNTSASQNISDSMRRTLKLLFYVENHILTTGMSTENKDGIYERNCADAHHKNSKAAAEFFNSMPSDDRVSLMVHCIDRYDQDIYTS